MKVNINAVGFSVDRKLIDFINVKLSKLERFYDRVVDADVYLKVENTSEKENKIVDVRLNVPGNDLAVNKQAKTFEEAIDTSCDALERLLLKHKERQKN